MRMYPDSFVIMCPCSIALHNAKTFVFRPTNENVDNASMMMTTTT